MYNVTTDPIEILSGTNNRLHPVYVETAKDVGSDSSKSLGYLKSFLKSLDSANKKAGSDAKISGAKGNITNFSGYDDIRTSMSFLDKHISGNSFYKNLKDIYNCLDSYTNSYVEAYERNVTIAKAEFECALHLLVMGLAWSTANYLEMAHTKDGSIIVKKRIGRSSPMLTKLASDMASRLKSTDHKSYLQQIVKGKTMLKQESGLDLTYLTEGDIMDVWKIFTSITSGIGKGYTVGKRVLQTIKRSMFGIIPLIRICLYFRYKKKADKILALQQQVAFIKLNIDQLQNKKNMDPAKKEEIIKKQQAVVEAFNKKAEKLLAELSEEESEVVTELKKNDSEIKNDSSKNDDFGL